MIVFEHTVPALLIWAGLAVALVLLALTFTRYVRFSPATLLVLLLRLGFLALLGWCLFLPQHRRSLTRMLKPRFLVALDTSRSMQLSPAPGISNRWSAAIHALELPWLPALAAVCDLAVYPVAEEAGARLDRGAWRALTPEGEATRLRAALRALAERYTGQTVHGLLLLSDGLDTRELQDDWAAESWPWPIYSVRLEPPAAWEVEPDVRVDLVSTPRRVTVGWNTELTAVISGQGADGLPLSVRLFKDGTPLAETPALLPAGGGAREVTFDLEHPETGVFTYRVEVPALPGERNTNDNSYAVSVQVADTRNRVLYVEGPPRWESKYLTRALRVNPDITPLTFIRGPDQRFLTIGARGSMTPDMTETQLAFFNIVVLGNLEAEELGLQRAENLLRFVDEGGSLVLLGGSKAWGENGFQHTPLRRLLPCRQHGTALREGAFPVTLTDAGRNHPAFAGDAGLWSAPPPVLSLVPGVVLAAGAEALVAAETDSGPAPVVASQRFGQGKVVAIFTDSLWKWKMSPAARETEPYERFWNQLLAWLSPVEQERDAERLELLADREQLFLGEAVELTARMNRDPAATDAEATAVCRLTTPDGREIPYSMTRRQVVTASGRAFPGYGVRVTAELPGLYTARASLEQEGRASASDPVSFFVKPFTPESAPRPANEALLQALARNSQGRFFESADALNTALQSLEFAALEEESVTYRSLWSLWPILACLTALLGLEWAVRKWVHMP